MTTESRMSQRQQSKASPKKAKTNKPKSPKKGKKGRKILLWLFFALFILLIGVGLAGAGLFWHYAKDAPALDDAQLTATKSVRLFDSNNEVFADLGTEKRELIEPTEVPQLLKDAVVSVEDKRFYDHHGVDPIRIIGSAISNFKNRGSGGGLQGGSTLTQQLIKLSYFSTKEEDQNIKRKAQEAWLAYQLEQEKSKEEILTYYINKVYMANGLYGMETAAQNYFGKTLSELTLPQAALLAGMPQAPNVYDPYTNPEAAKERRDVVLYTMLENDKITQQEHDEAVNTPIDDGLQPLNKGTEILKWVDNYVTEVLNEAETKTGQNPYNLGLDIYTNLDMNAQKQLYDIINSEDYVNFPDADMQVASTVVDVKTGQVKAQIGGRNIPDDVQQGGNLATSSARDVGSTMKPLIDYGPAIEFLNYSTGTVLNDKPTNYPGTTTAVTNADLSYYGPLSMRRAIMYSRNTTAVQTFDAVGTDRAAEFLAGLGIQFQQLVPANAISSNKQDFDDNYGVSSLRLAAAYAAFANEGVYNKPYYVNKIVYQDGTEEEFTPEGKRAMKDSTAYMMTDMLKDVINGGTAFNAAIPGLIQAGKTGTSNYSDADIAQMSVNRYSSFAPDSTFVGYTTHYSVSVWTGYKDHLTPIYSEDWGIASDVYREIMTYLSQNVSNDDWAQPDSVTRVGQELYVKGATIEAPTVNYAPATETSITTETTTESEATETEESSEPTQPTTDNNNNSDGTVGGTIDDGGTEVITPTLPDNNNNSNDVDEPSTGGDGPDPS